MENLFWEQLRPRISRRHFNCLQINCQNWFAVGRLSSTTVNNSRVRQSLLVLEDAKWKPLLRVAPPDIKQNGFLNLEISSEFWRWEKGKQFNYFNRVSWILSRFTVKVSEHFANEWNHCIINSRKENIKQMLPLTNVLWRIRNKNISIDGYQPLACLERRVMSP